MGFNFTPEEESFRKEVSDFLDREITPEIYAEKPALYGPGPAERALGWRFDFGDATYHQEVIAQSIGLYQ